MPRGRIAKAGKAVAMEQVPLSAKYMGHRPVPPLPRINKHSNPTFTAQVATSADWIWQHRALIV